MYKIIIIGLFSQPENQRPRFNFVTIDAIEGTKRPKTVVKKKAKASVSWYSDTPNSAKILWLTCLRSWFQFAFHELYIARECNSASEFIEHVELADSLAPSWEHYSSFF
jgi:hypothetical protein